MNANTSLWTGAGEDMRQAHPKAPSLQTCVGRAQAAPHLSTQQGEDVLPSSPGLLQPAPFGPMTMRHSRKQISQPIHGIKVMPYVPTNANGS